MHPWSLKWLWRLAYRFGAGLRPNETASGDICSLYQFEEILFDDQVTGLCDDCLYMAGAMHTSSDLIQDANDIVPRHHFGPIMAYPDSGHFKMPGWVFEDIITPEDFASYAKEWADNETQVIGACCGTGLDHIRKLSFLRELAS